MTPDERSQLATALRSELLRLEEVSYGRTEGMCEEDELHEQRSRVTVAVMRLVDAARSEGYSYGFADAQVLRCYRRCSVAIADAASRHGSIPVGRGQ